MHKSLQFNVDSYCKDLLRQKAQKKILGVHSVELFSINFCTTVIESNCILLVTSSSPSRYFIIHILVKIYVNMTSKLFSISCEHQM